MRDKMVHWIAVILAVVSLTSPAFAQSPRVVGEAGNWKEIMSAGLRIYSSVHGSNLIQIACDEAMTLDHSATGISLQIGGPLPASSQVRFVVDGEAITIPSDKAGGISTDDCPECASTFAELWPLLRQGSTLEVVASDGRRATFLLRGTSRLMPPEPCPSGVSALGSPATAHLDVPFVITPDEQMAGCASSTVTGLDPNGDGFLAVRSGPGTQYRKIDEIHNGDVVRTCDARGPWIAIYYGPSKRTGWVHGRWLKHLAG